MSYVIKLLKSKEEEYRTFLDIVDRQLADGTVFRSQGEIHSALKAKALYEEVLDDIENSLAKLGVSHEHMEFDDGE